MTVEKQEVRDREVRWEMAVIVWCASVGSAVLLVIPAAVICPAHLTLPPGMCLHAFVCVPNGF